LIQADRLFRDGPRFVGAWTRVRSSTGAGWRWVGCDMPVLEAALRFVGWARLKARTACDVGLGDARDSVTIAGRLDREATPFHHIGGHDVLKRPQFLELGSCFE
jgi:hypothetical protein